MNRNSKMMKGTAILLSSTCCLVAPVTKADTATQITKTVTGGMVGISGMSTGVQIGKTFVDQPAPKTANEWIWKILVMGVMTAFAAASLVFAFKSQK